MKTEEELNALKEEVETLNKKLAELTEEEFAQVTGGGSVPPDPNSKQVFEPAGTVTRPQAVETLKKKLAELSE